MSLFRSCHCLFSDFALRFRYAMKNDAGQSIEKGKPGLVCCLQSTQFVGESIHCCRYPFFNLASIEFVLDSRPDKCGYRRIASLAHFFRETLGNELWKFD